MHYVGFVDPEDMNIVSGRKKFTSLLGYCSSKLAQVRSGLSYLTINALTCRYKLNRLNSKGTKGV